MVCFPNTKPACPWDRLCLFTLLTQTCLLQIARLQNCVLAVSSHWRATAHIEGACASVCLNPGQLSLISALTRDFGSLSSPRLSL